MNRKTPHRSVAMTDQDRFIDQTCFAEDVANPQGRRQHRPAPFCLATSSEAAA